MDSEQGSGDIERKLTWQGLVLAHAASRLVLASVRLGGAVLVLDGRDGGFELGGDLGALAVDQFFDTWPMCRRRCCPPT
jgi:hypothetical protein